MKTRRSFKIPIPNISQSPFPLGQRLPLRPMPIQLLVGLLRDVWTRALFWASPMSERLEETPNPWTLDVYLLLGVQMTRRIPDIYEIKDHIFIEESMSICLMEMCNFSATISGVPNGSSFSSSVKRGIRAKTSRAWKLKIPIYYIQTQKKMW